MAMQNFITVQFGLTYINVLVYEQNRNRKKNNNINA